MNLTEGGVGDHGCSAAPLLTPAMLFNPFGISVVVILACATCSSQLESRGRDKT